MIVTKPTPKSLYEIIKHTTGKTQEVIVVDIAQLLEAAKEHTIPGIQLTYKGEEIIYEDLEKAARKQRKNDRAYTKEFINDWVDKAYNSEILLGMLPGAKSKQEAEIRELTRNGLAEGTENYLKKIKEECCIFHADKQWWLQDPETKISIEKRLWAVEGIKPTAYARQVNRSFAEAIHQFTR